MSPAFLSNLYHGRRVGLLGGSFNPAHAGHLHISLIALKRLKLDEVWWIVSPQNPLKPKAGMADFSQRLASAKATARHPRLRVSDIETRIGTRFTYDTLRVITSRMPRTRFVWLMGADNLAGFHRWQRWRGIARMLPVAVFDRAPFAYAALHSKAAHRFRSDRLTDRNASLISTSAPPAICYLAIRKHPLSSTSLRNKLGKKGFLGHNENR